MNFRITKSINDLTEWDPSIPHPVILLSSIDRTPPHIAQIFLNRYYSYDLKKFDSGLPFDKVLNMFFRKKEKLLGLELVKHPVFSTEYMEQWMASWKMNTSQPLTDLTCLDPILDFLNEFYPLSLPQRPSIPKLIHEMKREKYIHRFIFINFKKDMTELVLQDYSGSFLEQFIKERTCFSKENSSI